MCSKISEKPKRARKGVTLNVKLDVIKRFDRGERNRDIVRALNLSASTIRTIYTQRERILKAAEGTTNSASSKVISFSRHPVMNKMETLLLEWIEGCTKIGVPLSYVILKEKSISFFNMLKQKAIEEGDESVAKVEFKGSHGWFDRFLKRGQLNSFKLTGESLTTQISEKDEIMEGDEVWSSEETDFLISLVEINKEIYNQSHPMYNNEETLQEIWQQIGSKLNKTAESCSKKWRILQSEYQERYNNVPQTNINNTNKDWPYSDTLDFLKYFLTEIPSDKSYPNQIISSNNDILNNQSSSQLSESNLKDCNLSISEDSIFIKTETEDTENYSAQEISNHVKSDNTLNNNYSNVTDYSVTHEIENYQEDYSNPLNAEVNSICESNSMKLFLLSLVEDASSLSKHAQRKFKMKTMELLYSLQE